jgi:hypothetical protein
VIRRKLAGSIEQRCPIRRVGDIRSRPPARGSNLFSCVGAARSVQVDEADAHAVLREPHRHGASQAAPGAGDQDGLLRKLGDW